MAGIGNGGTITGVGQVLQERKPEVKIVAVEPRESAILSGGQPGPHKIQGIGANFIGDPRPCVIDEVLRNIDQAIEFARKAATEEDLPGLVGAALSAAVEVVAAPRTPARRSLSCCGWRALPSTVLFEACQLTVGP